MLLGIGEAGRQLQVPPHVLHHWEHVGLLRPIRTAAGHRRYSEDDLRRCRLVMRLQRGGLSLGQIRTALEGGDEQTAAVLMSHSTALRQLLTETAARVAWLEHVASCPIGEPAHCLSCNELARQVCPDDGQGCDTTLA